MKGIQAAYRGGLGAPLQGRFTLRKKRASKRATNDDVLYKMHERWFLSLDRIEYLQLTRDWHKHNQEIVIQPQKNYDAWLNYFKTLPPSTIRILAETGLDQLPTEGYAALARWHDIISHPGRIDKIHQSGLTNPKGGKGKTVSELAKANDRLGVLKATRDKIAEKLDKGAGSRDTALLTREMTEIMTQIADYEKRLGPKKTTKLGKLIDGFDDVKAKRPYKGGGGARTSSFRSRVTIQDIE